MNLRALHAFPSPPKRSRVWAVVVAVVVVHLLLIWAIYGGLWREPRPPMLTAVVARLIEPTAPSFESAPLPPPPVKTTQQAKAVATPHAAPVLAPVPVPVPASTQVLASPNAALTAPTVPTASISLIAPPTALASATAATSQAQQAAAVATHTNAAPVWVAAAVQASGTCRKPRYPPLSEIRAEQGTVQLKFLIGADGRVVESQVEQTSGYFRLDEAARTALSLCQFTPGTVDGKPEASWVSMKYTWRLE